MAATRFRQSITAKQQPTQYANNTHHLTKDFANECNEGRYQSQNIIYPNNTYELPYSLLLTNNSIKLQNSISGDILEEGQFCISGNPVKDELYATTCR